MAYRQAKTKAEFKAATPKKRLYPDEEMALFEWAMKNGTWVSLADGKGNDKLNKIKIPPNKFKDSLKVATDIAPNMKIESGQGSSAVRGMATAVETAMQERATMFYIEYTLEKPGRAVPVDELIKLYPQMDDSWELSFKTTASVLSKYLNQARGFEYSRDNGMFKKLTTLARDKGGVRTKDAWNKMDILLTKKLAMRDINKELENVNAATDKKMALDILNDIMKRRLKSREMVGVSLKKIIKPGSAKAVEVAYDKRQKLIQPNNLKNIKLSWDIHPNNEWSDREFAFSFDADGRTYNTQARAFPISTFRDNNQIEPIGRGAGARLGKVSLPMALDPFYASLGLTRTMASHLPKPGKWMTQDADKILGMWRDLQMVRISGELPDWGRSINNQDDFKNMLNRAVRLEIEDKQFASIFGTKLQGLYMLQNMAIIDKRGKMPEFLQTLYYGAKGVYETAGPYVLIAD